MRLLTFFGNVGVGVQPAAFLQLLDVRHDREPVSSFTQAYMRIQPQKTAPPELLFYDGHCGLCHWAVRFVLARDQTGEAFHFAPLDSDAFRTAVPEAVRETLPDSLVVLTAEGALLTRSAAVLHILRRLGGRWRLLAVSAGIIPAVMRDGIYDAVASARFRLFRRPESVCPLVPEELRGRFRT